MPNTDPQEEASQLLNNYNQAIKDYQNHNISPAIKVFNQLSETCYFKLAALKRLDNPNYG